MNILAIDNSTNLVWWAFYQDWKLIDHWNTSVKADSLMESMNNMKRFLFSLMDKYCYDVLVTEDPMSLARVNPKVCFKLCMNCAMIIDHCQWVCQFEMLSPTQIKKVFTGKGNAKKDLVREEVKNKFGLDIESEDEADSVAIWYTFCVLTWLIEITK